MRERKELRKALSESSFQKTSLEAKIVRSRMLGTSREGSQGSCIEKPNCSLAVAHTLGNALSSFLPSFTHPQSRDEEVKPILPPGSGERALC